MSRMSRTHSSFLGKDITFVQKPLPVTEHGAPERIFNNHFCETHEKLELTGRVCPAR